MIRLFLVWLSAALLFAMPARADELRPGYMEFSQQSAQDWRLVLKAPIKGGLASSSPVLPKACRVEGEPKRDVTPLAVTTTMAIRCVGPVAGQRIGLSDMAASQSDVLVRVAPLSRPVQASRLTADQPDAEILAQPQAAQVAKTYLLIGIEHILTGYDHLLFVIALVLLLDGILVVTKAVTAFTVAHSITLIGSTLGLLWLPQDPVESVIALSIVFLAVEIAKKEPGAPRLSERVPWVVAFLFGLLHGFGFAGALKEVGLPQGEVPMSLLTFNVGVEIGQLAVVAATLALLGALRRWLPGYRQQVIELATMAIGITASFWLIERTLT